MNYEDNKYSKQIRITPEDLEWIKTVKGKLSAAGYLEKIIKHYQDNEYPQSKPQTNGSNY